MILRARMVLPMGAPPIANGAVAIRGEEIVAVGPLDEVRASHPGPVRDLGDVTLLPGLINAHCHLDYTCLKGELSSGGNFTDWLARIVALKQQKSPADYRRGIREGINELLRGGTTTVVNIAAFPELIAEFVESPLRIIWCPELIDVSRPGETEAIFKQAEAFLDAHPQLLQRHGFSPHALYTASAGLYLLAAKAAAARGALLTTHLAESVEEDDMFRRGSGRMYDFFLRAGRDMSDCKHASPIQLLAGLGALGPGCIAAHVNLVTPLDVELLKQSGAHVAHCPNTHRFFGRGTPPLKLFWQAGVNVCLGTDSLASNDRLNLFAEMQTLAHTFPEWAARELLELVTLAPARALGKPGKLGVLAPGATADLITVPDSTDTPDPYEMVVYSESDVRHVMLNGTMVVE